MLNGQVERVPRLDKIAWRLLEPLASIQLSLILVVPVKDIVSASRRVEKAQATAENNRPSSSHSMLL